MPQLTDKSANQTPAPARGAVRLWDDKLAGLHVEIRPSGRRSFRYRYREQDGRQRTLTVGQVSELTVAQARKAAGRYAAQVRLGGSPAADKKRTRQQAAVRLRNMASPVLADSDLRAQTRKKYREYWERFISPALGHRPVAHIGRADVSQLLDAVPGNAQHNHVRAFLSRVMSEAVSRGHIGTNPVSQIPKARVSPREDFMSAEQLRAVWEACEAEAEDPNAAAAIQLILLTGCRKGEALQSRWEDFDLEAALWSKPASATKSRRRHTVYLDTAAVDLVRRLREAATGPYLFPSPVVEGRPRADVRNAWARVKAHADLHRGWRVHDLRHSYASLLAAQGVPATAIQQLLGHSSLSITQRYVHAHEDALRRAVQDHGVGNVVQLHEYRKAG